MVSQDRPAGLFVVRAWHEDDRFRARLTYTTDITRGPSTVVQIIDSDQIAAVLSLWLSEMTDGSAHG